MSGHPFWQTATHAAAHSAQHGSKAGAAGLIVVGIFLAPALIGIPILFYGIYKLCS